MKKLAIFQRNVLRSSYSWEWGKVFVCLVASVSHSLTLIHVLPQLPVVTGRECIVVYATVQQVQASKAYSSSFDLKGFIPIVHMCVIHSAHKAFYYIRV
jgi:hypothetical protein